RGPQPQNKRNIHKNVRLPMKPTPNLDELILDVESSQCFPENLMAVASTSCPQRQNVEHVCHRGCIIR
ncbi:5108_t:CDS:1, partial [Acaulospora morrowiae]